MKVCVVGGSGFIGAAVVDALAERGAHVKTIRGPRASLEPSAQEMERLILEISEQGGDCDVLINAAGNPDASETDIESLVAANASSAEVVARSAERLDVGRLIHVSSAVVQGRRPRLDASMSTDEFSSYAFSKAEAERRVLGHFNRSIVYRPPSVHHKSRRVTRMTVRIGSSPLSSVAAPGDQNSPQALLGNVASAVAFLATCEAEPPSVVIHPSEGISSAELLEMLGGRRPRRIPRTLARTVVRVGGFVGKRSGVVAANSRRLEMLWFGQEQDRSWLEEHGWSPPYGKEKWFELGAEVRDPTSV